MSKIARIPVSTLPGGYPGFVRWIKNAHPPIYRELANRLLASGELRGLGITAPTATQIVAAEAAKPSAWANIGNTVRDIVAVALPLYQQQQIFDAQLKRANAGQSPLDTSALADAASVKVGLDASTRNTGLLIAGGLGLLFVGAKLLGGRRS